MPRTILLYNEFPKRPFCVCVLRNAAGNYYFSYYDERHDRAVRVARHWSGSSVLYVVRVIPKEREL